MSSKGPGLFFDFYKKEHSGVIFLVILALLLAILPRLVQASRKPTEIIYPQAVADSTGLYAVQKNNSSKSSFYSKWHEQLKALGLSDEKIKVIYQKVKKGEPMNTEQWLKITGLPPEKLNRVLLPRNFEDNETSSNKFSIQNPLELNTADSADLVSLPGIGPKYCTRIISYRNKLGGFYNSDQLFEIWYLDTSNIKKAVPYISVKPELIKKLEVNKLNEDLLIAHPYFSKKEIGVILAFKSQHGNLTASDIDKNPVLSNTTKTRMKQYLLLD